jgi:hypothetical protein
LISTRKNLGGLKLVQTHKYRFLIPEFNLVVAAYNFITEREYFDQIKTNPISKIKLISSLLKTEQELGVGTSLTEKLALGGVFWSESIESMIISVDKSFKEDFGYLTLLSEEDLRDGVITENQQELLDLYSEFLDEIADYCNLRGLDLFSDKSSQHLNQYDLSKWNNERVVGYQVTFHLSQFLGFDPLFFKPLDKSIFRNGKFVRHHFRDNFFRKASYRVSDTLLTDKFNHGAYEEYSEGFIASLMNSLIENIQSSKVIVSSVDLRNSLTKFMKKYLDQNGGHTLEGDTVKDLVEEVWNIWTQDGVVEFENHLSKLNEIRAKYVSKDGNFDYPAFLNGEYGMDSNSRFVKNARDFQMMLTSDKISGSMRDLYALPQDINYMQLIFPKSHGTRPRITFIFNAVKTSQNIQLDWINYLETQVWKI